MLLKLRFFARVSYAANIKMYSKAMVRLPLRSEASNGGKWNMHQELHHSTCAGGRTKLDKPCIGNNI